MTATVPAIMGHRTTMLLATFKELLSTSDSCTLLLTSMRRVLGSTLTLDPDHLGSPTTTDTMPSPLRSKPRPPQPLFPHGHPLLSHPPHLPPPPATAAARTRTWSRAAPQTGVHRPPPATPSTTSASKEQEELAGCLKLPTAKYHHLLAGEMIGWLELLTSPITTLADRRSRSRTSRRAASRACRPAAPASPPATTAWPSWTRS